MNQILLITISGEDQAGVTAGVTGILATYGVNILDIGQSVIHATLSLGILAELPDTEQSEALSDALAEFTEHLDLRVRVTPVAPARYGDWVEGQGSARCIITLLARKITADQLSRVTAVVVGHGLNIDGINRLSGRIPLGDLPDQSKACVEFSVRGSLVDPEAFRRELLEVAGIVDMSLPGDTGGEMKRKVKIMMHAASVPDKTSRWIVTRLEDL